MRVLRIQRVQGPFLLGLPDMMAGFVTSWCMPTRGGSPSQTLRDLWLGSWHPIAVLLGCDMASVHKGGLPGAHHPIPIAGDGWSRLSLGWTTQACRDQTARPAGS